LATNNPWAGPLGKMEDGSDRYCTGCHREGGPGKAVAVVRHPQIPDGFPTANAGIWHLPLFSVRGDSSSMKSIDCQTCHHPHGRDSGGGFDLAALVGVDRVLVRAARPMLRAYVAPNACSACHGFDGLQRFLNYHADRSDSGGVFNAMQQLKP